MGFLFDEKYAGFQLFGPVHIAVLALGTGSIVALYYLRGPLTNPAVGRIFRYTVATLLVIAQVSFKIWALRRGELHWMDTIPLGLCDMMQWITLVALYFDLAGVIRVVLPWAFTGATLSFIVVDMGTAYTFPHYRFFHYFGNHWLFLVGNLYYLNTCRFTYPYRALLRSTAWLAGVSAAVLALDFATNTNNMFLRAWPVELDFMNRVFPFPVNTLLLMLGIFAIFNIFYLIFVVRRFDAAGLVPDGGTVVSESGQPV